jgi:hypothetical protein
MKKFNLYLERVRDFINEDVYYFFESQDRMIQLMNEILSIIQGSYGEDASRIRGSFDPNETPKPDDNIIATISSRKDLESRFGEGTFLNFNQKKDIENKYNEVFDLLEESILTGDNAIYPSNVENFFTGVNILHRSIYRTKEAELGDLLRDRFDQFLMFIETQLLIIDQVGDIKFDVATMKSYLKGLKKVFKSNLLIQSGEKEQFKTILKMTGLLKEKK